MQVSGWAQAIFIMQTGSGCRCREQATRMCSRKNSLSWWYNVTATDELVRAMPSKTVASADATRESSGSGKGGSIGMEARGRLGTPYEQTRAG